ncbi:iron uptake transporter permease EfeU [Rhodococcus sp. SGAir0479]|uniref:iron uptake transporter permease EfeU n=1 Tax=Rhodococcus sp. SGAir0479 TaxID=2567884 RepID=UPI0010CD6504|nr:iron uptake transporter permease EfeU [Rhodococcus sp. SGAir0479]QCQ90148.1 iron transporter [Rhodococcus sp. SGAir0479]
MSVLAAGATAPSIATQLFGSGLIGVREGLETGIVVMILVAFLVKAGRRDALKWVWTGVGAAVAMVAVIFGVIHFGTSTVTGMAAELISGLASLVAVAIVTAMVLWMRTAASSISGQLRAGLDRALAVGPAAVAAMAFFAVGREGVETALLLVGYAENAAGSAWPLVGLLLGIVVAAVVTVLLYVGAVRIDFARFFRYTGVFLVVVAAGILAYGVRALQIAGWLPGGSTMAFDISSVFDTSSWYGTVLQGIFNFRPDPTVLQVVAWVAYLVVVLPLFLRPVRPRSAAARSASDPTDTSVVPS